MSFEPHFSGFNKHPRLEGSHAFLSPSNPHWIRYDVEKLIERLNVAEAAAKGTALHKWAEDSIILKREQIRDPHHEEAHLNAYVNDAIDLGMTPEQTLFYSLHCYGTTDCIGFDEENMYLNVHDLKTGVTKVSFDQLYVYAAIFCHEYGYKPFAIRGELRIYQVSEILVEQIDNAYLAQIYSIIPIWSDIVEERRNGVRR